VPQKAPVVNLNPLVVNAKEVYNNSHGLICRFNSFGPKLNDPYSWISTHRSPFYRGMLLFILVQRVFNFFHRGFSIAYDRKRLIHKGPWFWGSIG
jgi:hypothetical protein